MDPAEDVLAYSCKILGLGNSFLPGAFNSVEALVFLDDLFHLCFDCLKIDGIELTIQINVVVKAVFRGRADIELCFGKETQHGCSKHVGARVTQFLKWRHFFHNFNHISGQNKYL